MLAMEPVKTDTLILGFMQALTIKQTEILQDNLGGLNTKLTAKDNITR